MLIRETILSLIEARGAEKTICPSEVARHLAPHDWRALMPAVRAEAEALRLEGRIRITQGGVEVEPLKVKGPIRLGIWIKPTQPEPTTPSDQDRAP
jgi:hypothetical protein